MVPEQNLELLVSSRGGKAGKGKLSKEYRKILLSGVVTAFGITLHNFPEGLAIFLAAKKSTKLGLTLTAAMTLHNLPEGVAVALPIYFATKSRWQALKVCFLSGLAEPLAVVFAAFFFPASVSKTAVDAILFLLGDLGVEPSRMAEVPAHLATQRGQLLANFAIYLIATNKI